jgi:very-short-patch-repair endonuclease
MPFMHRIPPRSTRHARKLRKNQTPAEGILWASLRSRRFADFKFRRQTPVGPFIVDFICKEARVIVELDGESHVGKEAADNERIAWFEAQGFAVIRVWNAEVYENFEKLLELIYEACVARSKDRTQ